MSRGNRSQTICRRSRPGPTRRRGRPPPAGRRRDQVVATATARRKGRHRAPREAPRRSAARRRRRVRLPRAPSGRVALRSRPSPPRAARDARSMPSSSNGLFRRRRSSNSRWSTTSSTPASRRASANRTRELAGHARGPEAEGLDLPDDLRRCEGVEVGALADEVVDREGLVVEDLDRRIDGGDAVALDAPGDRDAAAAHLGVEQHVEDVDGDLVAQLRRCAACHRGSGRRSRG